MPLPELPPQGGPPGPWKVPSMVSRTLPSGLQIVVARLPWLPVVHIRWALRGGRLLEAPGKTGSAGLLGSVARHGTARYDSAGLASALDYLGASLRISVGLDSASAGISGLSEHTDVLLDLVDEALLRPTFPEAHFIRERDNALQVHRHQRAQPSVIAGGWLARSLYGNHPYGHPAVVSEELAGLTAGDLRALHSRILAPQRGLVLVVGDVDAEATADALSERYADFPVGAPLPKPPPATLSRRLIAIERAAAEQVVLLLGLPLFSWGAPDHLPMEIVNQALGGGAGSRLFNELRERDGLTYSAWTALDLGIHGGDFSAGLSCSPDKAPAAMAALMDALKRPLTAAEISGARRYIIGAFPQRASGVGGVAALLYTAWLYGRPVSAWADYLPDIASLSDDAIRSVADRLIRPEQASIVAVGPADVAAGVLSGLGDVEARAQDDRGFEVSV